MCVAIIIEAVIVYIMNCRCSDVAIIRISVFVVFQWIFQIWLLGIFYYTYMGNFGMGKIVKFDKIVSLSKFYLPIIKYKIIELLKYEMLILWNS